MRYRMKIFILILTAGLLLGGCAMTTVEDMYAPPKRSDAYKDLQRAIDEAMADMEYAAPLNGENRQSVQIADLNGDGREEYLLFARDTSENPLKILIFDRDSGECRLKQTIESSGAAFDLVEYVDLTGDGKLELVVGRQVSNLILRSAFVFTFSDGGAKQLLNVNYSKIVPADLDADGVSDLMVITRGESDADNAVAAMYSCEDGVLRRSRQADLSGNSDRIRRIMVGKLHDDVPAVYIASNVNDSAIITDIFALREGKFTNISFSNDSGTSVRTLRNYYVYADDIDDDGILELPDLIDMVPVQNTWKASNQQIIRWYAMDTMGRERNKQYTFHNFDSGWYLLLNEKITPRISVVQKDGSTVFYLWDEAFENAQILMKIDALTGSDRENINQLDRHEIYRTETAIYTVRVEAQAEEFGFTPELVKNAFHLIQTDWKNGET